MNETTKIGNRGEDIACDYLKERKYKILERNFLRKWGELDIIALSPDKTLVFVEVKTMKENPSLRPEDNLTRAKLIKLKRTASLYAGENEKLIIDKKGWRIDLIAILLSSDSEGERETFSVKHFENI